MPFLISLAVGHLWHIDTAVYQKRLWGWSERKKESINKWPPLKPLSLRACFSLYTFYPQWLGKLVNPNFLPG